MKSPRFFFALLLALVLVFAQQASALHALSHTADTPDTAPHEKLHPIDLVFASIQGAATPGPIIIPSADCAQRLHADDALFAALRRIAHYRSRAPPSLP